MFSVRDGLLINVDARPRPRDVKIVLREIKSSLCVS